MEICDTWRMIGLMAADDPLFDPQSTALPRGVLSKTLKAWAAAGKPPVRVRVSLEPPHAVEGRPVVLEWVGGREVPLDDRTGVEKALIALRWRREDLARACGKGRRAIDNYLGRRPRRRVPAEVLLVLKTALEAVP
jgi:hypothetical protein